MQRFAATSPLLALSLALTARAQTTPADMPLFQSHDSRVSEILQRSHTDELHTPVAAEISPDGTTVAWILGGNSGGGLHISQVADSEKDQVISPAATASNCHSKAPRWSPDGRQLAFISTCTGSDPDSGQPQLFLWTRSTGETRQITHITGNLTSPNWSPDGKSIAFLYVENATRAAGALAAMKSPAGVIGEDGVEIQWVAKIDLASGNLSVITPKTLHAYEFDWAPDSQHIAYVAAHPPGENTWWIAQIYTQAVSDPATAKSILNPATAGGSLHGLQIAVPRYSPNGKNIAFIGGLMSDQGSNGGDIYLMGSDGSGLQDLTTGRKSTPAYLIWADDDHIAFSEHVNGKTHIGILGTNGHEILSAWTKAASVASGRSVLSFSASIPTRRVAFVSGTVDHPAEVWAGDFRDPKQITHLSSNVEHAGGKIESLEWENEGFHVQGWLTLPTNYDPAKKYPLIVSVHGGPSSEVGASFRGGQEAIFSQLGYFVLQPNPRGSYGQGEAFTQANRKDFGYGDLRDILKGVDTAEARYSIDDKRVGITGWSYGGFMTMFAITQTHRFRAAVAGAGISNWQSYYGENSIDQWMVPFFGASVYDDPTVYAKSSAINYVKNATTPTLILVGDRDGECPAPQSYELWHALRARGLKTQLVIYPNEGHRFVSAVHLRDRMERTVAWFEENMPSQ